MADNDLYEILEISPTAAEQDIAKSYKKLAKQYHPDLNPGDKTAEDKFKVVAAAYEILGNSEKRGQYDRGEIDSTGAEVQNRSFYHHYADADPNFKYHQGSQEGDFVDLEDILSHLNIRGANRSSSQFDLPGRDVQYHLEVDFIDAANGTKKRITLPDGKSLDVRIPEGLRDGQVIRLKEQGLPGTGKAPRGDAYVKVSVRPHKTFSRVGEDIHMTLPISLNEAINGGTVSVPTLSGPVKLTIPKGANTGQTLRLRNKGISAQDGKQGGNQMVRLSVVLPTTVDPEFEQFIAKWTEAHAYDPRKESEASS